MIEPFGRRERSKKGVRRKKPNDHIHACEYDSKVVGDDKVSRLVSLRDSYREGRLAVHVRFFQWMVGEDSHDYCAVISWLADGRFGRCSVRTQVDGIVVATTTSTHAAVLESVLALDVPVFVEKPMTDDVASAAY